MFGLGRLAARKRRRDIIEVISHGYPMHGFALS